MRSNGFLAGIIITVLTGASAFAQNTVPDVIEVGGQKVHPHRFLARRLDSEPGQVARPEAFSLLQRSGMKVKKEIELVPGLMILEADVSVLAKSAASSPDQRAADYVRRLEMLRDSGQYAYVTPDYLITLKAAPSDSKYLDGTLWGLANEGQDGGTPGMDIGAPQAWDISTGSPDVIVSVVDTGIRYDHRDLNANMWVNPGEIPANGVDDDGNGVIDDIHGYNATTGTGDPLDDQGHGTHVAGTIGAVANNGYPHVGVAWTVRLMACKFLTAGGFGFTGDAIDAINYSVKMGAKVSNHSWGGYQFSQALLDTVLAAGDKGQLFVAASGNETLDSDLIPAYPASFPAGNIVSVAAIDRKGLLATFSNFGQRTVHLGAPGVDIYSTISQSTESYGFNSGTSMASPHVSGVAALILAAHPKADLSEVRERILGSVIITPSLRDTTITGGRVNAFNAINATADGALEVAVSPVTGSSILIGTSNVITVRVSDVVRVTNATVRATVTFPGGSSTNLTFKNNGTPPDQIALDGTYSEYLPASTNLGTIELSFTVTAPGKTGVTNQVVIYQVIDRPANDKFETPEKIPVAGGIIRDFLQYATREPGEPLPANVLNPGGSLWYAWSPPANGTVLIDTSGSTARTVVAVYTGSSLNDLTEIGSVVGTDTNPNGSLVLNVTAGVSYRISVSGATPAEVGAFRLRVVPNGKPDTVPPVVTVTSPPNAIVVTTNVITITGTATDQGAYATGVSEVLVKVNEGIASSAAGTTNWGYRATLRAGINTIQVVAEDLSGNRSSPIKLTIDYRAVAVANDLFRNAINLGSASGSVTNVTDGAAKESGEPDHAGNEGGKSVWYKITPSVDGVLTLSTEGSEFDTLLAVYTGEFVNQLIEVGSNDEAAAGSGYSMLSQGVLARATYYIAVDGFADQSGKMVLKYSFGESPLIPVQFVAGAGGAVDNPGGQFGEASVASVTAIPSTDYTFVQWKGAFNSYMNPLSFTVTKPAVLEAVFSPVRYTDDFESGDLSALNWSNGGSLPWTVQSGTKSRGTYAAQAGAIANSQDSILVLENDFRAGIGSFDFKVSSEEGWDTLEFAVDGQVQETWSGVVDWTTHFFNLTSGHHRLTWRYSKDAARGGGLDTAFIDSVLVPVLVPVNSTTPALLSVAEIRDGIPSFRVDGQLDQVYVIQASSNLSSWTSLSTNVNANGFFIFTDDDAKVTDLRFFRAIVPSAP